MHRRLLILFAILAPFCALLGCGSGASSARLSNDLKQVGLTYHLYHDDHQVGPASWDEFIDYANKMEPGSDVVFKRVRDAGYNLKWKVKFSEVKEGLSSTVLGEKPGGGPKLMMDGSVQ